MHKRDEPATRTARTGDVSQPGGRRPWHPCLPFAQGRISPGAGPTYQWLANVSRWQYIDSGVRVVALLAGGKQDSCRTGRPAMWPQRPVRLPRIIADGFRGPFVGMPVTETPRITGWGHVRG
jgi:hypothetical protein